jgi:flagellar hook-associated protein 2
MGATVSSIFAGNSRYANDFQAVIDRATAIASLPISQLDREKTALAGRSTALAALDVKLAAFSMSLAGVEQALGSGSWQAALDGPEAVAATLGPGAMEGSYSIEAISLGAYARAISDDGRPGVTNPDGGSISGSADFTLRVDGVAWALRPASNTLAALAAAIGMSGAAVSATVVNVGSSAAPDYRLSLESRKLGPVALELDDGQDQLVTSQAGGSKAVYRVNGVAQEAESDSRTVTLGPGLTVELKAASPPGEATSITVTRQSSALASALGGLAAAYNEAMDELDKHRGEARGALSGQQLVHSLGQMLRDAVNYSAGGGAVGSLADLGFGFDSAGRLSFNAMAFMGADMTSGGQVAAFLGGAEKDGFLRAAAGAMDSATNPVWGRVRTEMASVDADIRRTDARIAENRERVNRMQVGLQERMAEADALIASLEQQYRYISTMLEAMQAAREAYR